MDDKKKKRIYFWLFVTFFLLFCLTFYAGWTLTQDYNESRDKLENITSSLIQYQEVLEKARTELELKSAREEEFTSRYESLIAEQAKNCKNFSDVKDILEIRTIAESYIVAQVKNAKNIIFEEIHLVGSDCNPKWWVNAEFDKKIDDNDAVRGAAFLTIDAITKDLEQFNAFNCIYEESSQYQQTVRSGCEYTWSLSKILGETKHEASRFVELE